MKTISLDELEECLIARKRQLGIAGVDFLPLNDGKRRTASKRRLLRAIAENAAAQGRSPRFTTKRD
jgi:hypothetical protein